MNTTYNLAFLLLCSFATALCADDTQDKECQFDNYEAMLAAYKALHAMDTQGKEWQFDDYEWHRIAEVVGNVTLENGVECEHLKVVQEWTPGVFKICEIYHKPEYPFQDGTELQYGTEVKRSEIRDATQAEVQSAVNWQLKQILARHPKLIDGVWLIDHAFFNWPAQEATDVEIRLIIKARALQYAMFMSGNPSADTTNNQEIKQEEL